MKKIDFEALFRASPYPYLVMDNDLVILDANNSYLKSTHATREAIVGKYVFDAFPSNPNDPSSTSIAEVKASLEKAIVSGLPDITPFLRYAVPKDRSDKGEFEEKYWSTVSTPVLGDDGKTAFVVQHPIDVTDLYNFNRASETVSVDYKLRESEGADHFNRAQMHEAMLRILNDERGHLKNLFNHAPGFVAVLIGPNHVFEMVNEAYYQLVGHRPVLGRPVWDALPEVRGQGFEELLDKVYQTGEPWVGKSVSFSVQRDPNGPLIDRYIDLLYQPIFDAKGNVGGIFAQGHDVTDAYESQLAHREAEARLQDGMVAAQMVVWDWDLKTEKITFSENAKDVFGYTPDSLEHFIKLIHSADQERAVIPNKNSMEEGLAIHETLRFVRPDDGKTIWLDVRGKVVGSKLDAVHAVRGVTLDITDRMEATEKLRRADQQKDEFLAMLAHELRNPLAPISSAAHILAMDNLNQHQLRSTSEIISRQIGHLTGLVDDLLDVSRVTRGLITTDTVCVDIKSVISDAIEQTAPLLKARNHEITISFVSDDVRILGDHKRMVQVITNLLTNAAKYTPHGGSIQVGLDANKDSVIVSVADNGIGIPEELLPHVFELFTQAERTIDRTQGGLGIGLALVKSLVEIHGGTVAVTSPPEVKGSRFQITLPRSKTEGVSMATCPIETGSTKRILVVDDNEDAANMLTLLLQTLGHEAEAVYSARDAIEYAETNTPQVALLDIGLPEMDGYALASLLRSRENMKTALIVAVTGYGAEEHRREALAAGFDDHLVKPLNIVELGKLLERCE